MVFVGTLPVVEGGGLVVLAYDIRDGHVWSEMCICTS